MPVVSSGSPQAGQPAIVVGPPAFAFPSLPLRVHAASSCSHPLRLGQGTARSDLCLTRSGKSSLSPLRSHLRVIFHLACCRVRANVCAEVVERSVWSRSSSEISSFLTLLGCIGRPTKSPPRPNVPKFQSEQLTHDIAPNPCRHAGNC